MRFIGAIILIFLLLSVTFSKWVIIAGFRMNQKYIAEKLCINKNKPGCCCHGKCYLNKQLDKDEKGDAQNLPQNGKEKMDIQLFFEGDQKNEIFNGITSSVLQGYELSFTPQAFYGSSFRPPEHIV